MRGEKASAWIRYLVCVTMEMEAAYVRGRLSVDEYLKQCAIVNPHLELHYRLALRPKVESGKVTAEKAAITADKAKTDQVVEQQKTQLAAKDAKVNDLTNTVAAKADALDSEKRNSGSLLGSLGSAWHWIEGLGVVAVIIAGLLLYLRMGLGSVGKGLHGLQSVLSPEDYQKVVSHLDGETDKLHQWLIRGGREAAAKIASLTTQPKT